MVKDLWFSQAGTYSGQMYFYVPEDYLRGDLQVEVCNAQGEVLFSTQAYGEDGKPNPDWRIWEAMKIANVAQPLHIYRITQRVTGEVISVGEMVTITISDASTGETLFTDTRALVAATP